MKIKNGFRGERAIVLPKVVTEMMQKDPLVSQLYITDIGFYPTAQHHYRERKEPISEYVLIYCVRGTGWYSIEGKHIDVTANHLFILPAGLPHAYGSSEDDPWSIYWLHFSGHLASCYCDPSLQPKELQPSSMSRLKVRQDLFEEIFNTLDNGYSIENLRYMSSLLHYYLGTVRYMNQYRQFTSEKKDGNIIEAAIRYMKENIGRHLTMSDLAGYLGYSESHFSQLFRAHTGHAPINYFNLMKMHEACDMLTRTNMKINQICPKLGIDDSYYFSRLFSKTMGLSPLEYRKKMREEK